VQDKDKDKDKDRDKDRDKDKYVFSACFVSAARDKIPSL
jgi:hypothetical protein